MTRRQRLATFGSRGQLVRLFVEERDGVKRHVVQWGPKGARQQESFAGDKKGRAEAEAYFTAFGRELETARRRTPLTNRELWIAYLAAEGDHIRPRSRILYASAWRTWEQFAGAANIAQETTVLQCAEFRRALEDKGLATATIKATIGQVRTVFNWGERMEVLDKNKWHLFLLKIPKDKRTKPRAEYRADEFLRIWAVLDPESRGQWRAWVAVGLLGIYGNRQNEILNLRWSWVSGDAIEIPAEFVKTGDERTLRLFPLTQGILERARAAADREGYVGDFVLFPGQSQLQRERGNATQTPHYSIQSLTGAIHRAEARSGVETVRWRAGHGFRRGLVGDLVDETGDVTLALQAIGDRDLSMATHYRVRRHDKVDAAIQRRAKGFGLGGADEGATEVQRDAAEVSPDTEASAVSPSTTDT